MKKMIGLAVLSDSQFLVEEAYNVMRKGQQ